MKVDIKMNKNNETRNIKFYRKIRRLENWN